LNMLIALVVVPKPLPRRCGVFYTNSNKHPQIVHKYLEFVQNKLLPED